MLINSIGDMIILIISASELKSYHFSQLSFWGFTRDPIDGSYKLAVEKPVSVVTKLLTYLDNEDISYSLSSSCQRLVLFISQEKADFEKLKIAADEFKDGQFDVDSFNEFRSFVRHNISRRLRIHQLKAAYHLYLVKNGANFSVPGSGKTSVVLSVYEKLRLEGKVNLLFVVGPPACFGPWKMEFQDTLGRKAIYSILAGGDAVQRKSEYFKPSTERAELYLTTFQTLLKDQEDIVVFLKRNGAEVYFVIDEAHYIKQLNGQWANSVLHMAKYAKFRCALTGTPIPRSFSDIFNLFDFLCIDNTIDPETKIRIQLDEEKGDLRSAKELLKKQIGPLFYRVRKSELGLIVPIFHPPDVLSMNKYERILYDAIEKKIRNYSLNDYLRNIDLVKKLRKGRIIRLRQCASYAKLLFSALENYDEDLVKDESDLRRIIQDYDTLEKPAKLHYLEHLVAGLQADRQKVVIWANFVGTLELISNYLTKCSFINKIIYGKTPIEQTSIDEEETREAIRDEFADPQSGLDILIANPAACAESISLHKTCFNAVYYDLSYNCAQYLQSLDRIHRVGGSETNQANYHFLQYDNTIDQDIKQNLDQKSSKMYQVIDEDYAIYSLDMFQEEDDEVQAYQRMFGSQ